MVAGAMAAREGRVRWMEREVMAAAAAAAAVEETVRRMERE
jgi:hypothetical protein